MDQAFVAAVDDPTVGAIVLLGAGDSFCSGHDLGSASHQADLARDPYELGVRGDYKKWSTLDVEACLRWRSLPKPVVAAVQGFCIYHGAHRQADGGSGERRQWHTGAEMAGRAGEQQQQQN